MTYLFYPYQWAGRSRWAELAVRTSADPLHEAFLQAGAARVVVPVREGFEHTVARYLEDGVVPEWGPEPWRGRPSGFLPVDELIADANDRPARRWRSASHGRSSHPPRWSTSRKTPSSTL
jgi:hypothetical protein